MTDKVVSFKSGRKPVALLPSQTVKCVTTILSAFCRASDDLVYPVGADSGQKDLIFCEKIASLSADHQDLTSESLTATRDYLEASVKHFSDCRIAGDDAIERAGNLILRDLTREEMKVFDSMDTMDGEQLAEMKLVIDLLTAKWRASVESNEEVHPENSSNETMLMIVKHILKTYGVGKLTSKFTSRKRPAPAKSARYNMGAVGFDSQHVDDDDDTLTVNSDTTALR